MHLAPVRTKGHLHVTVTTLIISSGKHAFEKMLSKQYMYIKLKDRVDATK